MATALSYSFSGPSFLLLVRPSFRDPSSLANHLSAVAARFGIGGDFWLNLFLTLAGYIPGSSSFSLYRLYSTCSSGHMHNFYIQNIRNNKNHRRTPKWAQRYGLVDTDAIKRKERRSQWATRYEERHAQSTLENQPVEDGQNPEASGFASSTDSIAPPRRRADGELWSAQDEQYYGHSNGSSESRSSRWHYPANFDDAAANPALGSTPKKKKKKIKKDRFARTEDAYSINEDTTPRRKKKRSNRSAVVDDDAYSATSNSTGQPEVPEDPEGGHYGDTSGRDGAQSNGGAQVEDDTNFEHQF
jgi:Proteolipid membrane potential modulator